MKKIFLILLGVWLFALTPYKKIIYNGYISKVTYNGKYLIAGLENGNIIIKNFNTLKTIDTIKLPKIHDFMGDLIAMPIYSLDISSDGKKLMILAEGEDAKRILYIYNFKTKKMSHIFTTKETLMKGHFIGDNKLFFALLSDEDLLYDLKTKKNIYRHQIGNYVFSTYAIDKKRNLVVFGDESGVLKLVNINNGKKIREIQGYNKDKTLSIDIKKNLVINASSDMRIGIYDVNSGYEKLALKVKFLPYAAALSPDGKYFAVQYDENNDIAIFTVNGKLVKILKGHSMALNGMKYLSNGEIISYSPAEIIIWKLK